MIGMLTGRVESVETDTALIDVGGVGYEVRMSATDLSRLHAGQDTRVFTYMNLSQDAITLHGFILELKGSIDLSQIEGASAQAATSKSPVDTGTEQVVEGLISLGWRQQDAQQAVAEACAENDIPTPLATDDVPRVLRLALALMDRGR